MKRGGSLSFLVGTISNVLVMEIGWTDVGSGGYIIVSCAHSNTSYFCFGVYVPLIFQKNIKFWFLLNNIISSWKLNYLKFICIFRDHKRQVKFEFGVTTISVL